jgi:hypothetical protein
MGGVSMHQFIHRQITHLEKFIHDFREGSLSLNSLIQRVEGISIALANKAWSDAIFPIVVDMEQINAATLASCRDVNEHERLSIEQSLHAIKLLAKQRRGSVTTPNSARDS